MTTHPELSDAKKERLAAETAKMLAEAQAALALGRKHAAEARASEAAARMDEISLEKVEQERKTRLAADEYHHVYAFNGAVSSGTVQSCMKKLTEWHRNDPGCDVEIVFNSPGGSVIDGMALFDYIQMLRTSGHTITTGALGHAASMGGILLQAGDNRWIGRESFVLIHEISAGTGGKIGEMKDDVKFYERICARVVDLFIARSGGKINRNTFTKNWTRTDWWLTSDECLKYGFVDEVR